MNELLRPEAFAVQWNSLTEPQQQAFEQIVDLLQAGVDDLHVHERQKNGRGLPPWVSDRRKSRLAFIDGGRGTGKSTLLYALVRALGGSERSDSPSSDRLLRLSEQVVLLEPLGMETLDDDTHLMAAILARVAKAVEDRSGRAMQPRQLLDDSPDRNLAEVRFAQYQARIAQSMQGNLQSRGGHLDSDAFAQEVIRNERSRLQLNADLECVLDELARRFDGGRAGGAGRSDGRLFVLPVDDIDLKPMKCLELLRLARSISTPQLFFWFIGDFSLTELVVRLSSNREFGELSSAIRMDSAEGLKEIGAKVSQVAASNLRKLVPPGQRVQLLNVDIHQALAFRPLRSVDEPSGDVRPSLGQLMHYVPIEADGRMHAPRNLAEFLLFGTRPPPDRSSPSRVAGASDILLLPSEPTSELALFAYKACHALRLPLRRLADLWFAFEQHSRSSRSESVDWPPWSELLNQFWQQTLEEDEHLTTSERTLVMRQTFDNFRTSWPRLGTPSHTIPVSTSLSSAESDVTTECQVSLPDPSFPLASVSIDQATGDAGRGQHEVQLKARSTRYSFLVWSDLDALFRRQFAAPYRPHLSPATLVCTVWKGAKSYSIAWPAPPFRLFRDAAQFDFAFSHRLRRESPDSLTQHRVLYHWISVGNKLFAYTPAPGAPLATTSSRRGRTSSSSSSAPPPMPESLKQSDWAWAESDEPGENWGEIQDELIYLSSLALSNHQDPQIRAHIREWLIRVALLLMPEVSPNAQSIAGSLREAWPDSLLRPAQHAVRAWRCLKMAGFYIKDQVPVAQALMTQWPFSGFGRAIELKDLKDYFSIARRQLQQEGQTEWDENGSHDAKAERRPSAAEQR